LAGKYGEVELHTITSSCPLGHMLTATITIRQPTASRALVVDFGGSLFGPLREFGCPGILPAHRYLIPYLLYHVYLLEEPARHSP